MPLLDHTKAARLFLFGFCRKTENAVGKGLSLGTQMRHEDRRFARILQLLAQTGTILISEHIVGELGLVLTIEACSSPVSRNYTGQRNLISDRNQIFNAKRCFV